jgi:hypothetical protein
MNVVLGPSEAVGLAEKAAALDGAARELCQFVDSDPSLAGQCGVEVNAVEVRTLLMAGAASRIFQRGTEAGRLGKRMEVSTEDLEQLSRLEGVISLSASRIALKSAALEAADGQDGMAKLGSIIGLTTGAVGLVRSFWP